MTATYTCPICGKKPVLSVTDAGNHCLRCDGDPVGSEPRHTVYVLGKTRGEALAIWTAGQAHEEAKNHG